MIANYHTHTARCHHATGTDREMVERAIESGLQILGFSDHCPYWFDDTDYYSNFRMFPEQLEEYVRTLSDLRAEYRGQIDLKIGLEVEYYPRYFDSFVQHIRQFPLDYILLGQHFIGNETEPGSKHATKETEDSEKLERYCTQVVEAIQTGLFTYVAHPDVLNFIGDRELYQQQMRRICQAANQIGIPLEVNFLGIWDKRNYPNPLFWQVAGEEGVTAVFGCDAHHVKDVFQPETEKLALKLLDDNGIRKVDTVSLRSVF